MTDLQGTEGEAPFAFENNRSLPFQVYLISDRHRMGGDPAAAVVSMARAGLRAFQWREKDLTPAENFEMLAAISAALQRSGHRAVSGGDQAGPDPPVGHGHRGTDFRLFVNDRADLALACGTDLHLTEASIPTGVARKILPPSRRLARSTHTIESAMSAAREGADFITFGPVYDTASKRSYGPPVGPEALRDVCRTCPIPVVALGGITEDRVRECRDAGAAAVAVIGAVWNDADPVAALRRLLLAGTR